MARFRAIKIKNKIRVFIVKTFKFRTENISKNDRRKLIIQNSCDNYPTHPKEYPLKSFTGPLHERLRPRLFVVR